MASKRIEVTESSVTSADQAEVFRLLADGSTWPAWSPISEFQLAADSETESVGAVRIFKTGLFTSQEEIVRVDEPHTFGYRLLRSRALHVREYQAEVSLAPHSAGTLITWTGSFRPLFPGSGWLWKRIIKRLYSQFTEGLADYADKSAPGPR